MPGEQPDGRETDALERAKAEPRSSGPAPADRARADAPVKQTDAPAGWVARVGWFVGIWIASVAFIGVVAYAIRAVLL